jgi:hypothetical protein
MNELIEKFAIDCAGQMVWNFPKDPEEFTFTCDELAKFAQLIVQECGQWIIDNAGAMEHLGPEYFAKAMIKDFGVES